LPQAKTRSRRQVFILHGFGGIGKTQLAVNFAREHQEEFSAVFWFNGSTKTQVQQDLVRSACRIFDELSENTASQSSTSTEDIERIINRLLAWLSESTNNRWLLVYDNIDRDDSQELKDQDPDAFDVTRYFPPADHGSILLTTRLSKLGKLGPDLQLSRVNEQQGIEILSNLAERPAAGASLTILHSVYVIDLTEHLELKKIVQHLGGIPLALNHAGSFMRQTSCTVADYLKSYEEQWLELFGDDKASSTYKSIKSAWNLSFGYVKQGNQGAAKLLLLWAHINNADVSYRLLAASQHPHFLDLQTLVPEWFRGCVGNRTTFLNSMRILTDHSLIEATIGSHSKSYSMHPLLHEWCYHSQDAERAEYARLALVVLHSAHHPRSDSWINPRPDYRRHGYVHVGTLLTHCDRFRRQFDSGLIDQVTNQDVRRTIYDSVSSLSLLPGSYRKQASDMAMFCYNGYRHLLGPYDQSTVIFGLKLAHAYRMCTKLEQAKKILVQIEGAYTEPGKFDTKQSIWFMQELGTVYLLLKKSDKAEAALTKAFQMTKEAPVLEPAEDLLVTLGGFLEAAFLYKSSGHPQWALEMCTQLLVEMEKRPGRWPKKTRGFFNGVIFETVLTAYLETSVSIWEIWTQQDSCTRFL
jgi:NB-ARC domain